MRDFFDLAVSGKLLVHSLVSLYRLVLGFAIGTLIGLSLGTVIGTSKFAERLVAPTIEFLAPIPPIAWIPLLIILLGIGEASKIALIALAVFIVVVTQTVTGIRSTDQKLIEVAMIFGKSPLQLLKDILLPSAMPFIFSGLRISLALSWILLIASEVIASSRGLGWLIWDSRNFSRPDDMLVGIISIGLLGFGTNLALTLIERDVLSWRQSFEGQL